MALSQELLDILACPICKVGVHLTSDKSGLECEQCHRIYPIRDDIPVMLVEEAKLDEANGDQNSDNERDGNGS